MSHFAAFDISDHTYKTVSGHPIESSILLPKSLPSGTHPVLVRFHGGFFITGSRLYEDWCHHWVIALAQQRSAIFISADYRLMPEAKGVDFMEDLADFWTWLGRSVPSILAPMGQKPDLDNVLVVGESAGGCLSIQSALLHNAKANPSLGINITAAICQYGLLDPDDSLYSTPPSSPRNVLGFLGLPQMPLDTIEKHIAAVKSGAAPSVVSAVNPPARLNLGLASVQQGKFTGLLGPEDILRPLKNLQKAHDSGADLVPMWLLHGRQDSAVPISISKAFYKRAKELYPDGKLLWTEQDGEHGFDGEASLDTPWIKEGVDFVEKFW